MLYFQAVIADDNAVMVSNENLKALAGDVYADIYKNSFFPRTIKDWNSLSESAVNSDTVNGFKDSISCY